MSRPSSAELREQHLREFVVPVCVNIFAAHPTAQSVTLSVGQYWNDEADDAVHDSLAVSRSRDPQWPAVCDEHDEHFEGVYAWEYRPDNTAGLDDNSTMITAFASFCVEESSQEVATAESHTPYAVIRRGQGAGVDVTVEIVGQMHRPEWEDMWHDGEEED